MQAARPSLQCFLFLNERSKTMKKTLVAAAILSLALTACGGGSDTAA
ncbi:TPA: polyamine ABC transporter substrate-binding protein, partial [Neisseria meningitidis]